MYATTVVGWDGSETAATAIAWAVDRALHQPDGARVLRIVRAVDDTLAIDGDEANEWMALARTEIADLAATVGAEQPGLDVRTEVVRGEPGEVLIDQTGDDALVVVGGENGHTEEYWYGSRMGARVSGAADGPVAVVPFGDGHPRTGVLVAVDDVPESEHLCRFAAEYASGRGEPLHAVYVGSRLHDVPTDKEVLDRFLAPVVEAYPGLVVESHVESGATAGALLRRARDRSTVVVGTRRLGPVRRFFLGSVSHALVTNAWCPTIVVPPVAPTR
jgi:nucleotide-binding universal stress UspA family protein